MIEETAVVIRVEPERVWIKAMPETACGACIQRQGCGAATLNKILPKREFAVASELPVAAGDRVSVAIPSEGLWLASLAAYALPLAIMLFAVLAANQLLPASREWLPELALAALLLTYWLINHFQPDWLMKRCFKPRIVGKC